MQSLQQRRKPSDGWTERRQRSVKEGWSRKARSRVWAQKREERGRQHRSPHRMFLNQKTREKIWPYVQQKTVSSQREKRWVNLSTVWMSEIECVLTVLSLWCRWTGCSVTAVIAGFIWYVLGYRQNWQLRKITCVWPAAQQTRVGGSESTRCPTSFLHLLSWLYNWPSLFPNPWPL